MTFYCSNGARITQTNDDYLDPTRVLEGDAIGADSVKLCHTERMKSYGRKRTDSKRLGALILFIAVVRAITVAGGKSEVGSPLSLKSRGRLAISAVIRRH
jgi:hypothetical protein